VSPFGKDAVAQLLERMPGLEARYWVADRASVESAITATWQRARRCEQHAPITAARLRVDVDRLLDRWWWLHLTGPEAR
jgi:hypothetical protein